MKAFYIPIQPHPVPNDCTGTTLTHIEVDTMINGRGLWLFLSAVERRPPITVQPMPYMHSVEWDGSLTPRHRAKIQKAEAEIDGQLEGRSGRAWDQVISFAEQHNLEIGG